MREFTKNERKYIILCLDFYERKKKVRWHDLYDIGLGKSTITRITTRFRELGYIKEESYEINEEKLDEIKERLKPTVEREVEHHKILKRIPKFSTLFLIITIIGIFTLLTFNLHKITNEAGPLNQTNLTDYNLSNPSSLEELETTQKSSLDIHSFGVSFFILSPN